MSILFPFLIIVFSIIIHEVAHGYAAYMLGDGTAQRAGRLTLNPIPHIDMIGSIIVPLLSFSMGGVFLGWAKPVPINVYNLRGKYSEAIVSGAGIFANIMLVIIFGFLFKLLVAQGVMTSALTSAMFTVIGVNISLAFFNLIPIPPFDGMAIIQSLFPRIRMITSFMYNPVYLILAILLASVIFSACIPYVFKLVMIWLGSY